VTEDPKTPPSDAPRAGNDPDATLVVDGQRVWDALKASAASGHSPAAAPAPSATESLDDDWDLGPESSKQQQAGAAPASAAPPAGDAAPAGEAPLSAETAALAVTAPPPAGGPAASPAAGTESDPFLDSDLLVDEEPAAPSQSKIITARPPPGDPVDGPPSDPGPAAFTHVTPVGFAAINPPAVPPASPAAPSEPPPTTAPAAPEPKAPRGPSAVDMEDQFAIGDFTGAMAIAEALLARDPEHVDALECLERCRTSLRTSLATKLGPLDRVPVVAVARDQLRWLAIDHKAGFILSHVDGVSSVEEIVDISGMKELEALGILAELLEQRIIDFAAKR
jgi:hypothetical protein